MYNNFYEFDSFFSKPQSEGKYDEALDILQNADKYMCKEALSESEFDILFNQAYIYSQMKDADGCLKKINELNERNFSVPIHWGCFDLIKELSGYEDALKLNTALINKVKESSEFKYDVHLPKTYDSSKEYPLFICLHGDGYDCNLKHQSWYWKPEELLENGYIVVYPQSSQTYFYNGFGWLDNPELSRNELKNCYEELLSKYSIDESTVIVSGFSGGATAALDIALNNTFSTKGVVALCPGDHLGNVSAEDASQLSKRGVKVVILEGENDDDPVVQHLLKVFKEGGLPHEYHLNMGVSHNYPDDISEKTMDALNFILSE